MMQKRFLQAINEMRGLINDWSAPVLLAVSGGADSVCMAELFAAMEPRLPFAVAHCNFRLRGDESDGDEASVREWARTHGVMFHSVSFDTVAYAKEHGVSIEMAARELRYDWFASLCSLHGYGAVAVAHNANDNAETLLLNLVRGTGLKGICGMSLVSDLPGNGVPEGVRLIRPLLPFTRKQIEGYLLAAGIPYREDSTNSSVEYKRNSIRHEVFPVLERLNPSYVRTLNREMGYFSEIGEIVEDHCSGLVADVVERPSGPKDDCMRISVSRLMAQKHWRYLLFRILEPYGFNSAVIESVEELLSSDRTFSGKCFRAAGHVLLTERGEIVVKKKEDHERDQFITVRGAGTYNVGGIRFIVEVVEWQRGMPVKQSPGTVILDAGKLSFPFVCRGWLRGDWLVPFGMKGRKKVSDLFADLKYDHDDKETALMIVDCVGKRIQDQHVAGVLGVRIDDGYKVTDGTSSVIRITLVEH